MKTITGVSGSKRGMFGIAFAAVAFTIGATARAQTASPAPAPWQGVAPAQASAAPGMQTPVDAFEQQVSEILGQAGGLTSSEAAQRAMATSFDVQARHQDVVGAAAALDAAFINYFPHVSGLARYARLNDIQPIPFAPGFMLEFPSNDARFGASINIPISDYLLRLSQSYAAARHSRRAAELNELAARLTAGLTARVSYYNWVRARIGVLVAEHAVQQSRDHLTDVQHMFTAGAVSQADVLRVQSQLANAQLLVARAQNFATVSEDVLRTEMHLDPSTTLLIGEDVRGEAPNVEHGEDFAHLFDEALVHRPELEALAETIGSLREQVRIARAGYFPRLDGFADLLTANPNPRYFPPAQVWNTSWEVGAQVTWAINDPFIAHTQVRQAEAHTAQVIAQRGAVSDGLRIEIMSAFTSLQEAQVAVQTTAAGLSAAEESYRVRRVLFRNGRATSVELTDAETDLTRARLEALNAGIDLRIARDRLFHAVGRDREAAEPHR